MIDAACLADAQSEFGDMLDGGVAGLLLGMLLVAAALALVAAPFVLRTYDIQVRRLMRLKQRAALPDAWVARQSTSSPSASAESLQSSSEPALTDLENASKRRQATVRRATWLAYAVFVVTSAVLVPLIGALEPADLAGYFIAVCFVGAVPAFINVRPHGSKTRVLVVSLILGVVLSILEAAAVPPGGEADPFDVLWAPMLMAALYFTIAHRTLRAVVIPLTLLLTVVLAGVLAALSVGVVISCVQEPRSALAWSIVSAGLALTTMMLGASVFAGRKAIDVVARLQERGFVSDISVSAGVGLTFIALLFTVGLAIDGDLAVWQMALTGGTWAGLSCATYAIVVRRAASPGPSKSLLVLRVFSQSRAAERLLDAVQTDWRYVGPVYQIAGPDLVRLNVDLYEFGKFVNAKLHELFLFGAVTREQLHARLVRDADREGRFRVNEIFCLETAWRETVEQIMEVSDAILLDVRGFGPERRGTAFELELLVRRGFMPKVVAIGDRTTNWDFFDERILAAGGDTRAVVREHITGSRDRSSRFVSALMRVAAGAVSCP